MPVIAAVTSVGAPLHIWQHFPQRKMEMSLERRKEATESETNVSFFLSLSLFFFLRSVIGYIFNK